MNFLRVSLMNKQVYYTSQFKSDIKTCIKQNKDMSSLYLIMKLLESGEKPGDKYKDHPLSGTFKGCRDSHIKPDWILI